MGSAVARGVEDLVGLVVDHSEAVVPAGAGSQFCGYVTWTFGLDFVCQ